MPRVRRAFGGRDRRRARRHGANGRTRLGKGTHASAQCACTMSDEAERPGERPTTLPAADRWRAIEPIIDEALECPTELRRAFVRSACAGNPSLLADVARLLAFHGGSDAELDRP